MGSNVRRLARASRTKPPVDEGCDVLELSVTVGYLGSDVKKEEIDLLHALLREHCISGLVSLERGETESHLHFQMVCRARCKSARSFGILTRKAMGWYDKKNMIPVGKVTCKVLTNKMLHTYAGMIGYCLKDDGKEHFQNAMFNVSDEEVAVGKNLHSLYGRADLKSRVTLTNKNISERMYVWRKYKWQRPMHAMFLTTLTEMIQSGMFIPCAAWIIPFGGQGMNLRRMSALWKCIMEPQDVTKDDICDVFVQRKEFVKGRYFSGDVDDPAYAQKRDRGSEAASEPSTPVKRSKKTVTFEDEEPLPPFAEFIPLQKPSVFSSFLQTTNVMAPSILNAGVGNVDGVINQQINRAMKLKQPKVELEDVPVAAGSSCRRQFIDLSSDSDDDEQATVMKLKQPKVEPEDVLLAAPVREQRTGGPSNPPAYRRLFNFSQALCDL